jgi:hypothetical protein
MHVRIERLYEFVMGKINLTESEQSHLVRCKLCVLWLDACAEEKISLRTHGIMFNAQFSIPNSQSDGN